MTSSCTKTSPLSFILGALGRALGGLASVRGFTDDGILVFISSVFLKNFEWNIYIKHKTKNIFYTYFSRFSFCWWEFLNVTSPKNISSN